MTHFQQYLPQHPVLQRDLIHLLTRQYEFFYQYHEVMLLLYVIVDQHILDQYLN